MTCNYLVWIKWLCISVFFIFGRCGGVYAISILKQITVVFILVLSSPLPLSSPFLFPILLFFFPFYQTVNKARKPCLQLWFCSFIGWRCKWKALCSCSPLFLSSCVLTFSLYLSLSLSLCRTTHWVSTRSETDARQDLSAQPGPPTQSWQGTPISISQPIKVSFATHM